jgi:hypothetical protein
MQSAQKAETKNRTIRVDDATWEKAQLVAEDRGLTRNQLIIEYIRSLKPWTDAKWGKKGPQKKWERTPGLTKARGVRVTDEDWAKGHEAAAMNDTSLSYLITLHLRSLKRGPRGARQAPATTTKKAAMRMPVDPATCPHKSTKTVGSYGTFCNRCGLKMEEIRPETCPHEKVTTNRFGTFCNRCHAKVERPA